MNTESVNKPVSESSNDLNSALSEFGVPKKRLHFVNSARSTSAPKTGRATAIQNLAPDTWHPRFPSEMTMDKALREMEFPSRLAGAEWTVP